MRVTSFLNTLEPHQDGWQARLFMCEMISGGARMSCGYAFIFSVYYSKIITTVVMSHLISFRKAK